MREASLQGMRYFEGLQITLVSLPNHLVSLEMMREACAIVLLGAVAWLAGGRPRDRVGGFLFWTPDRERTYRWPDVGVLTASALLRLAHGLSAHPSRMIIGLPDRVIENPSEWDVVPSHALPRIESVATLTSDIREATLRVEQLRERLILMGRADVVEQPDGFFR